MKKIMQRLLQMTAVFVLIMVVGVCLTACGGGDDGKTDETSTLDINQIQGLYGNLETKRIFYFDGTNYNTGIIEINETKSDGWQNIKLNGEGYSSGTISVGTYAVKYESETKNVPAILISPLGSPYAKDSLFVMSNDAKALPESFVVSTSSFFDVKDKTFSKISSLTEFAQEAFPFAEGYKIDPDDASALSGVWKDLYTIAA